MSRRDGLAVLQGDVHPFLFLVRRAEDVGDRLVRQVFSFRLPLAFGQHFVAQLQAGNGFECGFPAVLGADLTLGIGFGDQAFIAVEVAVGNSDCDAAAIPRLGGVGSSRKMNQASSQAQDQQQNVPE